MKRAERLERDRKIIAAYHGGKLMRELGDALEDGVLTDAESDSVCKAGYDLQERVAALMTAVQRNVTVRGGN